MKILPVLLLTATIYAFVFEDDPILQRKKKKPSVNIDRVHLNDSLTISTSTSTSTTTTTTTATTTTTTTITTSKTNNEEKGTNKHSNVVFQTKNIPL